MNQIDKLSLKTHFLKTEFDSILSVIICLTTNIKQF